MEEEKIDLTVINNGEMSEHESRMVGELTELVYRIKSLSDFLDNHHAGDNEDGVHVDEQEYDWMVNQYLCMVGYANALENRLHVLGFNVTVIEDPTIPV